MQMQRRRAPLPGDHDTMAAPRHSSCDCTYGGFDDVDLPPGSIYFGSNLVIDNLVFTPAPAGFAVLGLAGCLPRRRR